MTSARYDDELPAPVLRSLFRSPPAAFTRTAGDGRPVTPAGRVRALVATIAADPALVSWLRGHVAGQLEAAADRVAQLDLDGQPAAGELACQALRKLADSHRRGDTALW